MSQITSCFNCNSKNTYLYLIVDQKYSLLYCDACALVFTSPHPARSSVIRFNEERYDSKNEQESRLAVYDKEYVRAKAHIQEVQQFRLSGKLLDVGCSYGIGVKVAGDMGFEAIGIEPTKKAAMYAKQTLKLNVLHSTLEKAKIPRSSIDIVTLYDVLEHVPNIHEFLKEIYRILKPGGLLVIQSPNIDSFAAKLLKTKWNWLLVPQHLWHFSFQSLPGILHASGFSVVWKTTEDNIFDFASNMKSSLTIPFFSSGFIFKMLRYMVYIWVYIFISIGTTIWRHMGKGGTLRFYATKMIF